MCLTLDFFKNNMCSKEPKECQGQPSQNLLWQMNQEAGKGRRYLWTLLRKSALHLALVWVTLNLVLKSVYLWQTWGLIRLGIGANIGVNDIRTNIYIFFFSFLVFCILKIQLPYFYFYALKGYFMVYFSKIMFIRDTYWLLKSMVLFKWRVI